MKTDAYWAHKRLEPTFSFKAHSCKIDFHTVMAVLLTAMDYCHNL